MAVCSLVGSQGFVLRLPPRLPPSLQFTFPFPGKTQLVKDSDLLLAQLASPSSATLRADPIAQSGVSFVQCGYAAMAMLLLECGQFFQSLSPDEIGGNRSRAGRMQPARPLGCCRSHWFCRVFCGHARSGSFNFPLNAVNLLAVSCRLTAMPNAFFVPTRTTSFFPRVTAV